MKKNLGIYIHIPFCEKKCNYCAFFTFSGKLHKAPVYFKALEKEINSYAKHSADYEINTIYFGGGTPSLVNPENIKNILQKIKSQFELSQDVEVTLEANPESIDEERLSIYKKSGINRLSIGLQAWQDNILEYMDRLYTIEKFEQKYQLVRKMGFDNVSLDLIFGMPIQTFENWQESVANVIRLSPEHISCYSLELNNDSYWGRLYKANKFQPAEESLDRKMYSYLISQLKENGYNQYEISNFSKPGKESRHNMGCWIGDEYLGFGAAAHSYFQDKRFHNVYSIEKYIVQAMKDLPVAEEIEKISDKDKIFEYILLRSRLNKGIDLADFKLRFKESLIDKYARQIEKLMQSNLVFIEDNYLKLTDRGRDLHSTVLLEFM